MIVKQLKMVVKSFYNSKNLFLCQPYGILMPVINGWLSERKTNRPISIPASVAGGGIQAKSNTKAVHAGIVSVKNTEGRTAGTGSAGFQTQVSVKRNYTEK